MTVNNFLGMTINRGRDTQVKKERRSHSPLIGKTRQLVGFAMTTQIHGGTTIAMNIKHTGFTLIELMVVLAIAAILTSVAVPSFRSMIQNNRLATQANELTGTMNFARSEAIKRGSRVTVCVSADQTTCTGGTAWAGGWIAFADPDNSATFTAGDTLLRVRGTLEGGSTLGGAATAVQYLPSGMLNAGTGNYALATPGCTGNEKRTINITSTGRLGVTRTACP